MLPCPLRDHYATLRGWIETLEIKPEQGVAPAELMNEAFCEKMTAYGMEQAELIQPLWEKEYLD